MTFRYIEQSQQDGVLLMTLRKNEESVITLKEGLVEELETVLEALPGEDAVRVVVITGTDDVFLVGADLKDMRSRTVRENVLYNHKLITIFNRIENLPQPVIAALNGSALGGGLELALTATFRLANASIRLGLPEVKLGILPGAGGTQRLPRLIPRSIAMRLLLTGDAITADAAKTFGLVDEVYPDNNVLGHAFTFGKQLAQGPRLAVQAIKDAVTVGANLDLSSAISYAERYAAQLINSHDAQEGIAAFLEKRTPKFLGN